MSSNNDKLVIRDENGDVVMATYVEVNPKKFFGLPEYIEQREHKKRIEVKNVQVMFNEVLSDHLSVVVGVLTEDDEWEDGTKYKKGWKCKLDAHTRAEWWNDKRFQGEIPKKLMVTEYMFSSLKDMSRAYFRHNSYDSLETAADKFRGIMKKMSDPSTGKQWVRKSNPFQSGSIATLINAAHLELFDFKYPGKNNRGMDSVETDGVNTKSILRDSLRREQTNDFTFAIKVYDYFIKEGQKNHTVRTIKDPAFGAALLMYLWLHESEEYEWESIDQFIDDHMNKNVRNALRNYICTETYKGDPQRTDKNGDSEIHMEYPVNRIIRDCQPAPGPHDPDSIFHPTIIPRLKFSHRSLAVAQSFCDIMAIHNSGVCKKRKLPSDVINEKCKKLSKNDLYNEASEEFKSNKVNWNKQFSNVADDADDYEEDNE